MSEIELTTVDELERLNAIALFGGAMAVCLVVWLMWTGRVPVWLGIVCLIGVGLGFVANLLAWWI